MAEKREEKEEKKETGRRKDPRRRILLISVLLEIGVFLGIGLLFLLPSAISLTTLPVISPTIPSRGGVLVEVLLGIVGLLVVRLFFKKGWLRKILVVLILLWIFMGITLFFLPGISLTAPPLRKFLVGGLIGIVGVLLADFLSIYFWWAANNFFFTFVAEGTAKIVVKGGEFRKALIQWKDHTFDNEWNVVQGKERWHLFGGLRFYGIWPVYDIYLYRLRWTNVHADGTSVKHDQVLDSVMLKDMIYYMEIEGAEDKNKIPLKVGLLLTLRIINPYKALFKGQDWMELLNRIKPLFREHVASVAFEELIRERQKVGGELWERLEAEGLIQEFKNDYGVDFKKGGIEMKDITPPPDYQRAATLKYLAEREAEKRAGETVGSVINMMAMSTGRSPQEIQEAIKKSSKLSKEFRQFCQDLIHRKMAIDGKSYLDIRVSGASEPTKSLLELVSAWKRIPQLEKVTKKAEEKNEGKTKKEAEKEAED